MSRDDFFSEIHHQPVLWNQYDLHVPVFYQDFRFMTVNLPIPIDYIYALLPSKRLKPYRITPRQSVISITAYEYKESDIGPYNEVGISIPVTIDEQTPLFTGSLRKSPKVPLSYIHHLPVTTEIARAVGAEIAGYPKFIADIEFIEENNWLICELKENNQIILTMKGRKLPTQWVPRFRVNPITYRQGYLLRSELVISEREMGNSKNGENVQIEFGNHQIGEDLRALNLGGPVGYGYCPQAQAILTTVFESYSAL
jgi:hypothetical protein